MSAKMMVTSPSTLTQRLLRRRRPFCYPLSFSHVSWSSMGSAISAMEVRFQKSHFLFWVFVLIELLMWVQGFWSKLEQGWSGWLKQTSTGRSNSVAFSLRRLSLIWDCAVLIERMFFAASCLLKALGYITKAPLVRIFHHFSAIIFQLFDCYCYFAFGLVWINSLLF